MTKLSSENDVKESKGNQGGELQKAVVEVRGRQAESGDGNPQEAVRGVQSNVPHEYAERGDGVGSEERRVPAPEQNGGKLLRI